MINTWIIVLHLMTTLYRALKAQAPETPSLAFFYKTWILTVSEELYLRTKLNSRLLNAAKCMYYKSEKRGLSNKLLVKQIWA